MFIEINEGGKLTYNIKKIDTWRKISIENIQIKSNESVLGFYTDSPANEWLMFDDIELIKIK